MITFCLGSARQKRAYFSEASGVTVLDNVEVLFCASENGCNYFAFGDVPFGSFTVREYLCYCVGIYEGDGEPTCVRAAIELGIPLWKRLSALTPVQMRCVMFCEKYKTGKALVINLDGAKCSRREGRLLKKLMSAAPDVYICITDQRFMRYAPEESRVMRFGKDGGQKPSFAQAKKLAKKLGAKRVAVM